MKLLKTSGDAFMQGAGAGEAWLLPEEIEDLWNVYNLLVVGDAVTATTFRKVQRESTNGSVDSQKVKMTLRVQIKSISFEPEAGELRLGGPTLSEQEGVRLGSFHTLELELHRKFGLAKWDWDAVSLERLREATADAAASADLAAVLIQPGLANVCLLSAGMSIVRAKLEANIPKKGDARVMEGAKKATARWHEQVLQAVLRHVDFAKVKCVLLAGPGFAKDTFWEWAGTVAAQRGLRELEQSKPKWLLAHASSAYKHALKEVLSDPAVAPRVADTKAAAEVLGLKQFFGKLSAEPDRATYGYSWVAKAAEQGALETLLLTDSLFRAQDIQRRKQYVELVADARAAGAKVHIFSSLHVSGDQLGKLGGVAAVLRFPLPIDDLLDEENARSSSDSDSDAETTFRRPDAARAQDADDG